MPPYNWGVGNLFPSSLLPIFLSSSIIYLTNTYLVVFRNTGVNRTDSVGAFILFTVKQQRRATTGAIWVKHGKGEKGTQSRGREPQRAGKEGSAQLKTEQLAGGSEGRGDFCKDGGSL